MVGPLFATRIIGFAVTVFAVTLYCAEPVHPALLVTSQLYVPAAVTLHVAPVAPVDQAYVWFEPPVGSAVRVTLPPGHMVAEDDFISRETLSLSVTTQGLLVALSAALLLTTQVSVVVAVTELIVYSAAVAPVISPLASRHW